MSVRRRKTLIASPHREIGQSKLADRHNVIFAVIQLLHRPLLRGQIL